MTSSPTTMRAVRLSAPGPVDNLRLSTLPLPPERDGWVRIRVEAFGLNRSELKLRLGVSEGVSFPRVPGIEAAGIVDAALDLVGAPTLPDTLRAVRVHGTACFGGSLSNQWTVRGFSPNEYLPKGVRLAGYFGDAADLPREAFQEILTAVAAGQLAFPCGPRLRRPGAGATGPRRHGAQPGHRQTRRPRPTSACLTSGFHRG